MEQGCWLKNCLAPLCISDPLFQCFSGLVVQDHVLTSVGLLLGMTKLPEFSVKQRLLSYVQKFKVSTCSHKNPLSNVIVSVTLSMSVAAA